MVGRDRWLGYILVGTALGCGGNGGGIVPKNPAVLSVTVEQPNVNPIDIAGTVKLSAKVETQNGAPTSVEWSSSAPNVATVDQSGLVTGVAGGQANIIATSTADRSKAGNVSITVKPPYVVGVTFNSTALTIRVGESVRLTATVDTRGPIARTVTFTTSNPAVATVSSGDGLSGTVAGVGLGSANIVATSTADATKKVTLPVTVVDPCALFVPLTLGTPITGSVTEASCGGTLEQFSLSVDQPTTYALTLTPQFAADFTILADKTGNWFVPVPAGTSENVFVAASPNPYFVGVGAQSTSQRGSFTLTATANAAVSGVCFVVATTGVTVTAPLRSCSFSPQGRPAGVYNSMEFRLLPVFSPGDRLHVTVTAPAGVVPIVEVRFGVNAPVQAIATGTTLDQTFTAPSTAGHTIFIVSTRDPGQIGSVVVKIEGPPTIPFAPIVVGSGVVRVGEQRLLTGPSVEQSPQRTRDRQPHR